MEFVVMALPRDIYSTHYTLCVLTWRDHPSQYSFNSCLKHFIGLTISSRQAKTKIVLRLIRFLVLGTRLRTLRSKVKLAWPR